MEIKDYLGIIISVGSALLITASTFGGVKAQVANTSERIKDTVPRTEFAEVMQHTNNRLDRLETKIDRILERIKN